MEKKRVGIYVRVSSDEQKKEGLSIDAQINKAQAYCDFKGWKIYRIYKDEGVSASSIKGRKDFIELINDSKKNKFSAVLITKFDRAFRNTKEALNTFDEFKERGIDFVSIMEDIDTTTSMGKFFFIVISALAELEKSLVNDRVREVRLNKFNHGFFPARTPVGYKTVKKDGKVFGFKINDKESEIVKQCFLMTLNNIDYKEICKKLKIYPQQYYNIIKNKAYCGYVQFEGQEKKGIHEPIVSEEIYIQVRNKTQST